MQDERLLDGVRAILAQTGSIPALRASLFLLGLMAAFAWLRRRTLLALGFVTAGGLLGLGWWLIQIVSPMGLDTDAALTREWAQAGVDAVARLDGAGFVWGTAPEPSLVSTLARFGTPLPLVHLVPQVATLLGLGLLVVFPQALIRNTATARFAVCVLIGGGLWPGASPYASLLLRPSLCLALGGILVATLVLARSLQLRRFFNSHRLSFAGGLIAAAAIGRAWNEGVRLRALGAFLLLAASLVLASPVRALLRRASSSAGMAHRLEACIVLGAFCGSGLFWWNPPRTVPGFREATDENEALGKPLAWMARNVPPGDVILASPAYRARIAAFAGHRVLFPPGPEADTDRSLPGSFRRGRLAESTLRAQPIARLAAAFSVSHLFLGPGEASPVAVERADPDGPPRLSLVLVYEDVEDFRVFRLTKK